MNDILKAHSSAWLNAKAYRLAWLLGPAALATLIFGLQFWITPGNHLRITKGPMSYTDGEKENIYAGLKRGDPFTLHELRAAAEDDDPRALQYMGLLHDPNGFNLRTLPPNVDIALAYYDRAAELGNINAFINAGQMLINGGKEEESCIYFKKAFRTDPHHLFASAHAGFCMATEKEAAASEKAKGVELMETAAASGYVTAFSLLGSMYVRQVPSNFKQAVINFEKAVARNIDDGGYAHIQLGNFYFFGKTGVPQDLKRGLDHYLKGYEQGSSSSAVNLSFIYLKGNYGPPVDYRKAREYANFAAEAGEAAGHFNLFLIHYTGSGVPRDFGLAAKYCLNAISLGDDTIFEKFTPQNKSYPVEFVRELQSKLSKAVIYTGAINGQISPKLLESMRSLLNKRQLFE